MKIWSMVNATKAALRYFFLVLFAFALFSHNAFASTISGGNYTLNGGPTAISSAQSSGGTYSEQSTADPASGDSSGGVYGTTPAPAAPDASSGGNSQNQNSGSQNNNTAPTGNTSGYTGGVSGQIVMEKLPTTSGTSASASSGTETNGAGTGGAGSGSGGSSTILITQVRLVRGTPTSITVHFTTSIPAIGSIRYSPSAGEVTTLTDSTSATYHTFTITNLSPALVYQLQLAAVSQTGAFSGVYDVMVSPDEIGEEGSSAAPVLEPYHSPIATETVSTAQASSTTKTSVSLHGLPPYILVLLVLIIAIIIYIVWRRRRRSQ